jgi:chromosome segregation ATPase
LQDVFRLFNRLKRAGTLPEEFLRSACRLAKVEEASGTPYEKLAENHQRLMESLQSLRKEESTYKTSIAQLRKMEEQQLSESGATKNMLETYMKDKESLESASIDLKDLHVGAEFIRGAKDEAYLKAAVKLAKLESQTGKSYARLVEEYEQKSSDLPRLGAKIGELEQKISRLQCDCSKGEEQLRCQLVNAQVTREELARYSATREQLVELSVHVEQLHNLPRVLKNLQEAGHDHLRVVKYLGQISGLQNQVDQASKMLQSLQNQVNNEKLEIQRLQGERTGVSKKLEEINKTVRKRLSGLEELDRQEANMGLKILFTDIWTKLILDPSVLLNTHLEALIDHLEKIQAARAHATDLPIDYGPLRQELTVLFELVLGKQLILRETHLRETQDLRDKYHELLFTNVGRFAEMQRQLRQKETALEAEKEELKNANWQELTSAALSQIENGDITIQKCTGCKSTLACHSNHPSSSRPMFCPFCLVGSLKTASRLGGRHRSESD